MTHADRRPATLVFPAGRLSRWPEKFSVRDRLLKQLSTLVAFAIRGASMIAGYAITWWIGRSMGPSANGIFALVTQTAIVLVTLGLFGLDQAIVRHFAGAVSGKTKPSRHALGTMILTAAALLAVVTLIMFAGRQVLWPLLFGKAVPEAMIVVVVLIFIGRGLLRVGASFLLSQHRFSLGQSVEQLLIPLTTISCIVLGLVHSIEGLLGITAWAGIGAAVLAILLSVRLTSADEGAHRVLLGSVIRSSLPLWGVAIAISAVDWYGIVVAVHMLGTYDAGLFRVAAQLAGLMLVVSMVLYGIVPPRLSAAFHAGDMDWMARIARSATRTSIAFSLPVALVLLVFARPLLGLIGSEFEAGTSALRILTLGYLVNAAVGPAGITLAMAGRERVNLVISLISTATMLGLAPLCTALFGLSGLAASTVFLLVARNAAAWCVLRFSVGINILAGRAVAMGTQSSAP